MKKTIFYFALLFLMPSHIFAQDIFIDRKSGKEYLYLGSDNFLTNKEKWLDLKENKIVWFYEDYSKTEVIDMLTVDEFFKKTLGNGFVFLTSSDTYYWNATISKDRIEITNGEGKEEFVPIEFNYRDSPIDNAVFIMFHSKDRHIYGSIIERAEDTGCTYSLEEYSIYEVLINFDGEILKGCAVLEKK